MPAVHSSRASQNRLYSSNATQFSQRGATPRSNFFAKNLPALSSSALALGAVYYSHKKTSSEIASIKTHFEKNLRNASNGKNLANNRAHKILGFVNLGGWLTALWIAAAKHVPQKNTVDIGTVNTIKIQTRQLNDRVDLLESTIGNLGSTDLSELQTALQNQANNHKRLLDSYKDLVNFVHNFKGRLVGLNHQDKAELDRIKGSLLSINSD